MKKKFLVTAGAMALSMGLLAGCGAPKADEFVDKMFADQPESFNATVDMDIDLTADVGVGMDIDLSVSGDVDVEYDGSDKDAPATHMNVNLKYEAMGTNDSVKTEAYTITEENKVLAYAKDPEDGTWYVTEADLQENPLDADTIEKIRDEVADVLKTGEVEKKTESVNGEDCWVLKVNTTADAYMGVYDVLLDAAGDEVEDTIEDAGVDKDMIESYLSYFNMDITVYASKKSGQMVKMDVDMTETDTEGLLNQINEDFGAMLGMFGVDLGSASIELKSFKFSTEYSDWNNTEVEVPDDVKDGAVDRSADTDDWAIEDEGTTTVETSDVEPAEVDPTTTTDSDSDELVINDDGTVPLVDYYDNYICDVYPVDGYELEADYSSNEYIYYMDEDYNTIFVGTTCYQDWDDVIANGEYVQEDDGDYYVTVKDPDGNDATEDFLEGNIADESVICIVMDLGFTTDGIDGEWYPVYACMEGKWDTDTNDLEYPAYTIEFRYDDDDDWVRIGLEEDVVKDWGAQEYEDLFDEIFGINE